MKPLLDFPANGVGELVDTRRITLPCHLECVTEHFRDLITFLLAYIWRGTFLPFLDAGDMGVGAFHDNGTLECTHTFLTEPLERARAGFLGGMTAGMVDRVCVGDGG